MILVMLAMLAQNSFAAETSLGFSPTNDCDDLMAFQANYRETVWDNNYLQFKVGCVGGLHLGIGDGLLVNAKPFQLRGGLSVGPTLGVAIVELDSEAYLGVKDGGNAIGLQFDHFTGNGGRNYITIQLSQDF